MFSPPNIVDNIAEKNCLELSSGSYSSEDEKSFNSSLTEAVDFVIMVIRIDNDT